MDGGLDQFISDDEPDFDLESQLQEVPIESQHVKCVLLTGLPKTNKADLPKLEQVLGKICAKFGLVELLKVCVEGETPQDFAFAAFADTSAATACIKALSAGYSLGSKHTIKARPYSDLRLFLDWPQDLEEKEMHDEDDPRWWLSEGLDQFVMRFGRETTINVAHGPTLNADTREVYDGSEHAGKNRVWCDRYVLWSPKGTYLATFHPRGVALWTGKHFDRHGRLEHRGVVEAHFSPCEKFLVTWDEVELRVFETATSSEVKSIPTPGDNRHVEWPILRFSHDDTLMARRIRDGISVWDTASMTLLRASAEDTKSTSISTKSIVAFDWSPSENVLAYWAPESEAQPARVVVLDPLLREEVRSKNLVAVSNIRLHWHPDGDFLCAQVLRHTKSKKTTFTNFEFFRMRLEGTPNERLEERSRVETLVWEPKGTRFAVVKGESEHRSDVVFYDAHAEDKIEKLFELTNKPWNSVIWSPEGRSCVLVAMGNVNGAMEFVDVDECLSLKVAEHFGATEVAWDPSGRMVASVCTIPLAGAQGMKSMSTPGYKMWSALGDRLNEVDVDALYQFSWRPRPPSLLTESEVEEVHKSLGRIARKYEKEDRLKRKRADAAENAEKVYDLRNFRDLIAELEEEYFYREE